MHADPSPSFSSSPCRDRPTDAYLPPKEVARTIACRYFPNCAYGDKCIFFHPSSGPAAAAVSDPSSAEEANDYTSSSQSPPPHLNGFENQQFLPQQPFYNGYDAQNLEYLHFLAASQQHAQQQQQHGFLPPHLQQQAAFYGYSAGPQQQAYYYPQQQGQYASIPQAMFPQHIYPGAVMSPPQQPDQPFSPTSPTTDSAHTPASDPAIISAPPRTSVAHPSASASSPPPQAESTTSASAGLHKGSNAKGDVRDKTSPTSQSPQPLPHPALINGAYYPVAAMPMPLDALQAQPLHSSQLDGNASAQSAVEAPNTGQASPTDQNGEVVHKHQRTSSAQMRTLYQTRNTDGSAVVGPSTAVEGQSQTFSPNNGFPSTTRLPIHTGPRMHEALNGMNGTSYNPSHRRELSSSSALSSSRPPRSFAPSSSTRPPHSASRGPPRPFDPNRPIAPCKYFSEGGCRFGDACFFTHTLRKPLPIPGSADGQTTLDAKALKQNIGDPDGNPNAVKLRPGKFFQAAAAAQAASANGQRFPQLPNGVNAPLVPASASHKQANGVDQPAKDGQTAAPSTEEQLQR